MPRPNYKKDPLFKKGMSRTKLSKRRNNLKQEILRQRGLAIVERPARKPVRIAHIRPGQAAPGSDRDGKTGMMRQIEARFGEDIRDLLSPVRSGYMLAKLLDVPESTICRWRKRFGIDSGDAARPKRYYHGNGK